MLPSVRYLALFQAAEGFFGFDGDEDIHDIWNAYMHLKLYVIVPC